VYTLRKFCIGALRRIFHFSNAERTLYNSHRFYGTLYSSTFWRQNVILRKSNVDIPDEMIQSRRRLLLVLFSSLYNFFFVGFFNGWGLMEKNKSFSWMCSETQKNIAEICPTQTSALLKKCTIHSTDFASHLPMAWKLCQSLWCNKIGVSNDSLQLAWTYSFLIRYDITRPNPLSCLPTPGSIRWHRFHLDNSQWNDVQ
jgi:cytochrome b561